MIRPAQLSVGLLVVVLVAVGGGIYWFGRQSGAGLAAGVQREVASAPATRVLSTSLPAGCCGGRITIDGQVQVWEFPAEIAGKTLADGRVLPLPPAGDRVECFGNVMVLKTELPGGRYRLEVAGSENVFTAAGKRVFDLSLLTAAGKSLLLDGDIDLFARAGAAGKEVLLTYPIDHPGGEFKVAFTSKADSAKFSAVRIFNAQNEKVAWLFAEDVVPLLKLPQDVPVVSGPGVWRDASVSFEKRAADLVRRLTLREKVEQLSHRPPAVSRLGIPAYTYWNECLHGVARNGVATVFPQAIGMAASFDPALMGQVADTISTEARAKFNDLQAHSADGSSGIFQGLTFWTPNINIFRDPRWGRGQETYGEDPFLTSRMAVAFIRGLQGDDPKYLKTVATAKHFAVHSGPETLRHVFDAHPSDGDLYDTYLPAFEAAVKEGHVSSIMGAYNRVDGAPACASDFLLGETLRKNWGFQGYVVSDCLAIYDIWANHKFAANQAQAAAVALRAGCDLECGTDYGSLAAAVDLGLVQQSDLDRALERVLVSRFRLGLFDPPGKVRYAQIASAENDTPAHEALALQMARESIVLLKNENVLPLDGAKIKKIALVGPNGDGLLPLLGNYNGTPSRPISVLNGLRQAVKATGGEVVYVRGCDNALRQGGWQVVPDVFLRPQADSADTGFLAEYFADENVAGKPVVSRNEKLIDSHGHLAWTVDAPAAESARWTAQFVAPADGDYRVGIIGLSPYRLKLNGRTFVDVWEKGTENPASIGAVQMRLKAGQSVPIVVEGRAVEGMLDLTLLWDRADVDAAAKVCELVKDADVIIFAGGLDGCMEAEETDIRGIFQGFNKGDRTQIEMPACQTALMKSLASLNKPLIHINMTGSAMAMPWEAQPGSPVGAIVQAWYPGEAGGRAIADVLFGQYNPSGRLPVTFYGSTADLPPFTDYAMAADDLSKGRTYRYFRGEPLWAFGHGLSYSLFKYGSIGLSKAELSASADEKIILQVPITNESAREGDEVVQVYAHSPDQGSTRRRLVGFSRVHVPANGTQRVEIGIAVSALRIWDDRTKQYTIKHGAYALEVGGSSTDVRGTCNIVIK